MGIQVAPEWTDTLESALERAAEAERCGLPDKAVEILRIEIPARFGDNALAFVRSGDELSRMRRFDEADEVLKAGIEAWSTNPWVARSYALVARWRGDANAALDRSKLVRQRFPDFAAGHADYVTSLVSAGKLDDAEAAGIEAVASFPGYVWVAIAHALTAEARGDASAALERWRAAKTISADSILVATGELRALCKLGRYTEVTEFVSIFEDEAIAAQLWKAAADTASAAGAWSFAESWWERFRTAQPDDELGYTSGALASLRAGQADAARTVADAARARWPASTAVAALQAKMTKGPATPSTGTLADDRRALAPAAKRVPQRSTGLLAWLGF